PDLRISFIDSSACIRCSPFDKLRLRSFIASIGHITANSSFDATVHRSADGAISTKRNEHANRWRPCLNQPANFSSAAPWHPYGALLTIRWRWLAGDSLLCGGTCRIEVCCASSCALHAQRFSKPWAHISKGYPFFG